MNEAPLTHEETLELIAGAQAGDEGACGRLIQANTALVRSIVKKYVNHGTEYEDLFQIGCMGLLKAVRNFNAGYNVRFSTYAVPMIAGEIKRFIRDDGMIKVSRTLKELAAHAGRAREALNVRLGRDPTAKEIAAELGAEVEDVVMALEAARPHVSIYEPAYEDSDASIMDRAAGEQDQSSQVVDRVLLKELLGTLSPRERQIIMLRYFADKTQSEIAKVLGVSQVQVSRLESKIINRLRKQAAN